MQITHLHTIGIHREGVGAVFRGLEVDRYLILFAAANDGIFLAILRDVDVSVLVAEVELAETAAFVEAHDGVVKFGVAAGVGLGKDDFQVALAWNGMLFLYLGEGDCLIIASGLHQNAGERRNGDRCFVIVIGVNWHNAITIFVHLIERQANGSRSVERVAHEVPAGEFGIVVVVECHLFRGIGVLRASEGQRSSFFAGIEVALAVFEDEALGVGLVVLPFFRCTLVETVEVIVCSRFYDKAVGC